eukprot:gene4208-6554_t
MATIEEIPHELLSRILEYLHPKDLLEAMLIPKVWDAQCNFFWNNKYVSQHIRQLRQDGKPLEALKASFEDAKRTDIRQDELTAIDWCFRFKEDAGSNWLSVDPWWLGNKPRVIRFHDNGILTGFELVNFTWKFTRPNRQILGKSDRVVRIHVFPTIHFFRCSDNWEWIGESAWVQITSFPMPLRGVDPNLEQSRVFVHHQVREIIAYNNGLDWESQDPDQQETLDELTGLVEEHMSSQIIANNPEV